MSFFWPDTGALKIVLTKNIIYNGGFLASKHAWPSIRASPTKYTGLKNTRNIAILDSKLKINGQPNENTRGGLEQILVGKWSKRKKNC